MLHCLDRYYAQQRAADAISSNMVNDELKRHSRINKQLAEEQRVLEELYKVSPARMDVKPAGFPVSQQPAADAILTDFEASTGAVLSA
jgi:hypothetical protein